MQEMLKLDWLLKTTRGIEDAEALADQVTAEVLTLDGLKVEHNVEWGQIQRYVFPDLIPVVMKPPFRVERKFHDHIRFVVFPRTGQVLDLHAERIVTLESDRFQAEPELAELVNQMSSLISNVEGHRRGEAMKHLRALHRVLGLTQ